MPPFMNYRFFWEHAAVKNYVSSLPPAPIPDHQKDIFTYDRGVEVLGIMFGPIWLRGLRVSSVLSLFLIFKLYVNVKGKLGFR